MLDGWTIRQLGGPVDIPYPGLPIDEAAKKLGKHKEALRNWMSARPGRTRAARARAAVGHGYDDETLSFQEHPPTEQHPLGVRYVPGTALGRHFGMQTPVVWSEHALDPGAAKGRPPARWFALDHFCKCTDMLRRGPTATTDDIQPAIGDEFAQRVGHLFGGLVVPAELVG